VIDRLWQDRRSRNLLVDLVEGVLVGAPRDEYHFRPIKLTNRSGCLDAFPTAIQGNVHQDDIGALTIGQRASSLLSMHYPHT
jgi:hypothetical protein